MTEYQEMKLIIILLLLLTCTTLLFVACSRKPALQLTGSDSLGSANYRGGRFHNRVPTSLSSEDQTMFKATIDFFKGSPDRTPDRAIPVLYGFSQSISDSDEIRLTWLGHSTCLIEIDGQTLLTDPMFSDRASPFTFIGPKRFATDRKFTVNDLPKIDAVLISHDHYDHLDRGTIMKLSSRVERFYVPLGVGAHLQRWGVDKTRIVELNWWEHRQQGPLTLVATPARHFSGRGLLDRNKTLWASWTILGTRQRAFFSGDSGYFDGFKEIGQRYGPFDVTMLESGAYNAAWADIHLKPEETVQAHLDLKGKALLPIHWAKFNLALHPWTEPIERLLREAQNQDATTLTPLQGQPVYPGRLVEQNSWWVSGDTNFQDQAVL